ncbi:MAG: hypothetical protein ACLRM9_00870 [Collinsella aerofaciens]
MFEGAIGAGETVRIMTGAPVPEGADAVVKYEIVEVLDGDGNEGSHVRFSAPAKVGENVRSAAEEAHAGDVVIHAGEVVAPAGAGLLASAGYASVKVHAAPRVGIISLGTELVAPSKVPARGQIRDSNSSALMAEALDAGAEPCSTALRPMMSRRLPSSCIVPCRSAILSLRRRCLGGRLRLCDGTGPSRGRGALRPHLDASGQGYHVWLARGKPTWGFQAILPRRMWALRCSPVRRFARCAALPRVRVPCSRRRSRIA